MMTNSIIRFVVESGICLVSFYLLYWTILRKETFYQLNRIYLVSAVVISIGIPLLKLHFPAKGSEGELIASISSFSQSVFPGELIQFDPSVSEQSHQFDWVIIILTLYFSGSFILFARMVYGIAKILRIKREGISEHLADYTIIYTERKVSPFSFFNYVFLRQSLQKSETMDSILDHEYVHVRQGHTYDNLFIELALTVFWFNPIVWFYKEAIKSTHEYLADHGAVSRGYNRLAYKSFMLKQILTNPEIAVSSSFASRIRKRLVRINRTPSKTVARVKVLLAIPLIFILSVLFAAQDPNIPGLSQYPPIIYDSDSIPTFYMGQKVYTFPEEPATFNGGPYLNFREYISQQLKASEVKAKPGSRGLVIVRFIVDYNGDLSYAHAVLADAPELEAEAIRILKSSPKWGPAKQDDKDVSMVFIFPLRFVQ